MCRLTCYAGRTMTALTTLSEEERLLSESVLGFARERVAPHVARMDEEEKLDPSLVPGLFEMGLMGIEIPEEYGGAGGSFMNAILAVEALGRVDASLAVVVDVQNTLVDNAVLRWGNTEQKKRYLPKLASSWVGSYALSEQGSGSDAFALAARAERRPGGWQLTGRKLWITNAAEASLFIVLANVDPSQGYRGITAFLVERDFRGFEVGKKENKLGIRASSTCELILEGCQVPDENVLGEVGKGFNLGQRWLTIHDRLLRGPYSLGKMQRALDMSIEWAKQRVTFDKPIAERQAIQWKLVDMYTDICALRALMFEVAARADAGEDVRAEAAMVKMLASDWGTRCLDHAIQIHGAMGESTELPLTHFYRYIRHFQIGGGTNEIQRTLITRKLLR